MHIQCCLTALDCTFEQIQRDPHMHVNEAPFTRARSEEAKRRLCPELVTVTVSNQTPQKEKKDFFLSPLLVCMPGALHVTQFSRAR